MHIISLFYAFGVKDFVNINYYMYALVLQIKLKQQLLNGTVIIPILIKYHNINIAKNKVSLRHTL